MTKKKASKKATVKAEPKPSLVKMVRESDGKTADVHPDEVKNYAMGGYSKV